MEKLPITNTPPGGPGSCVNCGTPLHGEFCHRCGEKRPHPEHDFSIKEFAEQTVDGFTHFDGKFFGTFKNLLFFPGKLTADFIKGRRVPFMRPVQIFIICSLLFYFFIPRSDSFYSSYDVLMAGYRQKGLSIDNPVKYNINAHLKRLAEKKAGIEASKDSINKTANIIYAKAAAKMTGKSKTFLFVLLPFWALFIYLLFFRKQRYYVPHVVFALHVFSFFLLLDMAFLVFYFDILKLNTVQNTTHLLPMFLLLLLYVIAAVRKVYSQLWANAIWKGLLVYVFLLFLLLLYRVMITWFSVQTA